MNKLELDPFSEQGPMSIQQTINLDPHECIESSAH